MMAAALTLALLQQAAPAPSAAPSPRDSAGRPCQVAIDTVGHYGRQVEVRPGETNLFAGGGVRAHCQGTTSTLSADSVAWYAGTGRLDMLGQVKIRDSVLSLDAQTAYYYLREERLEAHKDVVATNRTTGTVLRGPNLTYYRVAKGIRDTAEMFATSRPTIDYRSEGDSGEPYVIVADRVRLKGNDRVWGARDVTIDRSDLAARGDSMMLDLSAGFGVLVGKPSVEGKGTRSYRLVGRRIEFGLQGHEVRRIKALGEARASSADWRLTADTIHMALDKQRLQQVFAWGDSTRPRAVSSLRTIQADSLALDLPDEVLTTTRAYRKALSTSRRDTTATAEQDWISGDTIVARWKPVTDSVGRQVSKLDRLLARGTARAFTHMRDEKDSTGAPSINYSRGDVIDVLLMGDRIDTVVVSGRADGLQLQPVPKVDTTKARADTTNAAKPVTKPAKPAAKSK